ncbi:hypothetical protein ACO2Q0_20575 [Phenylobacterium sp. VNQ135]|uniref:hypothetical protein n=1 Tax=Phenylobacterium sp. VNQ135 TaxID=3400922 RepID=UPI003C0B8B0A
MSDRYAVRPDRGGFSVVDLWTGLVAEIAATPQQGLSAADAGHTAQVMNERLQRDEPSAVLRLGPRAAPRG